MVVATTALVVAAGTGGGFAASKIGTGDLKNGAVSTPKVKNNAITSAKVKNNNLTGVDIKNGSLRLADFNRRDRARLQGETGPQGPGGPADAQLFTQYGGVIETVPPFSLGSATASCQQPDEVISGGGYTVVAGDERGAYDSSPLGGSWYVAVDNLDSPTSTSVQAWAICAKRI